MAFGTVWIQLQSASVSIKSSSDVAFATLHQTEVVPGESYLGSPLGCGLRQGDRFIQFTPFHQPGGEVQPSTKADAGVQWNLQSFAVPVDCAVGIGWCGR